MKKTTLGFLLILLVVGQAFTQQQTKSFTEYRFTLDLSQPVIPTSFELGTVMQSNNVWVGTFSENYPWLVFNNGIFSFSHLISGNSWGGAVWDGFTYSRNADNSQQTDWIANQWGNMAGGGIATDADGNVMKDNEGVVIADPNVPYLVAFGMGDFGAGEPKQIHLNALHHAVGVYINSHPWPYHENINGGAAARALNQNGDYFRLIIHGLDADLEANGQTVVHYLAKFERGTLTQSRNWEWVDLSTLGEIGGVFFTMESTDIGQWGMNTAAYFVIDRFTVQAKENGETSNTPLLSASQIEVFPNPVINELQITTDNLQIGNVIEIFDMNGRRVFFARINCQLSIVNSPSTCRHSPQAIIS